MRNDSGNLIYDKGRKFRNEFYLVAEVLACRLQIEYCINQHYLKLIMETNFLTKNNILDGNQEILWIIAIEITKIKALTKDVNAELANLFANQVLFFAGTNTLTYSTMQEIQREVKVILNIDRDQLPNLIIKRFKNKAFNNSRR